LVDLGLDGSDADTSPNRDDIRLARKTLKVRELWILHRVARIAS